MKLINSSIAARVIFAFAAVLLVVAALGFCAINRLGAVNDHALEVRDNFLPSGPVLSRIFVNLTQVRAVESQALIKGIDPKQIAQRYKEYADAVIKDRAVYEPMIDKGTDDEKFMHQFDDAWAKYQASTTKALELGAKGDLETGVPFVMNDSGANYLAAADALTKDIDYNLKGGISEANVGQSVYATTIYIVSGVLVFAALAAAALGFWLIRSVSSPVKAITGVMGRLADHDLSAQIIGRERGDEVGSMAKAVQVFKDNMVKADEMAEAQKAEQVAKEERAKRVNALTAAFDTSIGQVVQAVSSQSTQMESSAQSLSSTAEEATKQSAAVAAASEEASANVQTVASATEELSSSIAEISRQVSQSSKIAASAVSDAERANRMVQGLAEASQKIGAVVRLITDIANQTNLLALNATIEAARAGEAGKGFAVVAAEVKNLANQTAKATEEIGGQISGVQAATKDAVDAIATIGKTIGEINSIASTIAAAVEEQSAATKEIARNVEQASAGTQEVTSNITGVSQAANDTGSAATQVLASARELAQQSESLKSVVTRFLTDVKAA
ncbi:MAG TPA: methyl-accepting chemotaxis protein [Magnetospirillaceae bacterium]|jgi:methyl-accepting chemotaxis protein